eukprot:869641-Rhodomonas_salina.3
MSGADIGYTCRRFESSMPRTRATTATRVAAFACAASSPMLTSAWCQMGYFPLKLSSSLPTLSRLLTLSGLPPDRGHDIIFSRPLLVLGRTLWPKAPCHAMSGPDVGCSAQPNQVAEVVKVCSANQIPIVASGACTSLEGHLVRHPEIKYKKAHSWYKVSRDCVLLHLISERKQGRGNTPSAHRTSRHHMNVHTPAGRFVPDMCVLSRLDFRYPRDPEPFSGPGVIAEGCTE